MWPLLLVLPLVAAPQDDAPPPAPLTPRRAWLVEGARTQVQLSIDGGHVGWLEVDAAGVQQLLLAPVEDAAQAKRVTEGALPVRQWRWAHSGEHVMFTRDVDARDVHLFVIAKGGGAVFDVTPDAAGDTRIVGHGRQWPTHVALEYQPRDEARGVWLLDFVSKERHRMCAGGYARYVFDGNMWPVGANGPYDERNVIMRMQNDGQWAEVAGFDLAEGKLAGVVAADFGGDFLFYVDPTGRDKAALKALDLDTLETVVLAENERADLLPFGEQIDARQRVPVSVVSYHVRLERGLVDAGTLAELLGYDEPVTAPVADDWELIGQRLPGDVSFAGQDGQGRRWLLGALDGGPVTYHLYDRETHEVRRLFSETPALDGAPRATRTRFLARSRDGRVLPCDLYLPPGADPDGDGRPARPLPTVVHVHGGPWTAWEWDLWSSNRHFQLLASRGYALLRVDFRGSAGYGRAAVDAGDGEFGGAMVDDVVDAALAAVEARVAARERLAVWGWSYGGYAVLDALTRHPDVFACGLAMYGISDLHDLQRDRQDQPAWREWWNRRVGDPGTEAGAALLRAQSPIHRVEALRAPLLITHGGLDLIIPREQSDRFARAAHLAGKPVTYLVYAEEPHDYRKAASWRSWWAVGEHFLAEHLGGRAQPYGDDLPDPGLEVIVGAEHVPGLADAQD